MIILNREVGLPEVKISRKLIFIVLGVVVLALILVGALVINQTLTSSRLNSTGSLASEGSDSAALGSHNECEAAACVAKPGIGPNECTTSLDCAAVECDNVTLDPASPMVGATGVKFICTGKLSNANGSVSSLNYKIEAPGSEGTTEYTCPSDACTLLPDGLNFRATLTYPKALARGTYKVMTQTCFKVFNGQAICGEYKTPTP